MGHVVTCDKAASNNGDTVAPLSPKPLANRLKTAAKAAPQAIPASATGPSHACSTSAKCNCHEGVGAGVGALCGVGIIAAHESRPTHPRCLLESRREIPPAQANGVTAAGAYPLCG